MTDALGGLASRPGQQASFLVQGTWWDGLPQAAAPPLQRYAEFGQGSAVNVSFRKTGTRLRLACLRWRILGC